MIVGWLVTAQNEKWIASAVAWEDEGPDCVERARREALTVAEGGRVTQIKSISQQDREDMTIKWTRAEDD